VLEENLRPFRLLDARRRLSSSRPLRAGFIGGHDSENPHAVASQGLLLPARKQAVAFPLELLDALIGLKNCTRQRLADAPTGWRASMALAGKHPAQAADHAPAEAPQTVTGRTQWDAAVDILRLLGSAAPYLLIIALVAFGFYKFQELNQTHEIDLQKARDTATAEYRDQLAAANKALKETYQAMADISGTQIKNISDMLELHAKVTSRTQELQQNQEQQQAKLEQAKHDVETATNQKKQLEFDLISIQDSVAHDKAELANLDSALKEGKRNLSDSANQVSAVRDRMIQLARAIRDQQTSTAQQLAANILSDNIEPPSLKPGETDAVALKALIGRSAAEIVDSLVKDESTAFVVRNKLEGSDQRILAGRAPSGNLFRNITALDSDGNRITSARLADYLFGMITSDEDNWYSLKTQVILKSQSSSSWYGTVPTGALVWDLESLGQVVKNYNTKLRYLTLDQLASEASDVFKWLSEGSCEIECAMYVRAKDFNADKLFATSLDGLGAPRELREVAVKLFNAAVKRQTSDAISLITDAPSSTELLGRVAATVLHPDFEFTKFTPSKSGDSSNSANSATLQGHYDYKAFGFRKYGLAREQVATFVFSRGGGAAWRLERLTSAPQETTAAAR
jgi:predicted  nucleic acid-binding Zn-ribbon protein